MTQADPSKNNQEQSADPSEESVVDAFADALAHDTEAPIVNDAQQSKIHELQNRMIRMQADTENFRGWIQREQDELRRFDPATGWSRFTSLDDGLNRAISSAEQTGDMQTLLDGIKMVAQQFRDTLKVHAAEPIDALGQPFDPNLHEALTQIPSADHPPMTVLQVVEMGYRMHDRVVRILPCGVIVSSVPPEA